MWPFKKHRPAAAPGPEPVTAPPESQAAPEGGTSLGGALIEARLTKSVPAAVQAAIIRICEQTPDILACLVLDIREKDNPGSSVRLLFEMALTDRDRLPVVAARFKDLIEQSPSLTGRVYFASTGNFPELMRMALYRRAGVDFAPRGS